MGIEAYQRRQVPTAIGQYVVVTPPWEVAAVSIVSCVGSIPNSHWLELFTANLKVNLLKKNQFIEHLFQFN